MKYKAPAVHQAIEVLELLIRSGPYTLAQIAEQTGFSKATILRLLETMEAHSWVKKSQDDKTYESCVIVRPKDDINQDLESLIQDILDELCTITNHTIEWYNLGEDASEIIQRSEPFDRVVSIRAKLGFKRHYSSELDAVNRIAMASGQVDCKEKAPIEGYMTYKNGEQVHIPLEEALHLVSQVGDDLLTYDHEWNYNGIRRHAIGVKASNEQLIGTLAVATSFTPRANSLIDKINEQLQYAAQKIAKLYQ